MENINTQEIQNQIAELWASYDLHCKNARNTSSVSRMNLYTSLAKKAFKKACELQDLINN